MKIKKLRQEPRIPALTFKLGEESAVSGCLLGAARGAKADLLGQLAALLGVVWRDHRIVGGQAPTLTVLIGRHVVGRFKMPLQHLQFFAILETDDVIGRDRAAHRHGGFRPSLGGAET